MPGCAPRSPTRAIAAAFAALALTAGVLILPEASGAVHRHSSDAACAGIVRDPPVGPDIEERRCSLAIHYVGDPPGSCGGEPRGDPGCCAGPLARASDSARDVGKSAFLAPGQRSAAAAGAPHGGVHVNVSLAVNRLLYYTVTVVSHDRSSGRWGETFPEAVAMTTRWTHDPDDPYSEFTLFDGRLPPNRAPLEDYVVNLTVYSGTGLARFLLEYNGSHGPFDAACDSPGLARLHPGA